MTSQAAEERSAQPARSAGPSRRSVVDAMRGHSGGGGGVGVVRNKKRNVAMAPWVCGVTTGTRRRLLAAALAAGAGFSGAEKSSTAPVTPSVRATPKAMSAMSALRSALSALSVVGSSLKVPLFESAWAPKMVPTTRPVPARPSVM
jgi:hypothetical protein